KGYDLFVVGTEHTVETEGTMHEEVGRVVAGFDGPLAVVVAKGPHLARPLEANLNILLPVTGSAHSRRAADLALALAGASQGFITALYVASPVTKGPWRRRLRRSLLVGGDAVLKDVVGLAEQYGVAVRTVVRTLTAPEQ